MPSGLCKRSWTRWDRFRSNCTAANRDTGWDAVLQVKGPAANWTIAIEAKTRLTPQTALSVREQVDRYAESTKAIIPVVYAPVISPRVAQILKERDIGFVDAAGNCWIRSLANHLLIERTGFRAPRGRTEPSIDPFKPKSSRIVRTMLSRPEKGWQVRELADDANVRVSLGLVVKVKRALVEEGFAIERDKRVYLRDPGGLLNAWSEKYAGPAEQIPLYFRGDAAAAEEAAGRWCKARGLQFALAGFSAAWRLAPKSAIRWPQSMSPIPASIQSC